MRKNIKYSMSSFIIILSLMLSFVAYAEDSTNKIESEKINPTREKIGELNKLREENRNELKNKIEEVRNEIKTKKNDAYEKKDDLKNEIKDIKDNDTFTKEERKTKIDSLIQSIKENRDQFKIEFESKKEEVRAKANEIRIKFKENLGVIKNEIKKRSTENIVDKIQELNVKTTNNLSDKIDQIEKVLISIESRINKMESDGLDLSLAKKGVEDSKIAIEKARTSILSQASKIYTVEITDETTLKTKMTELRNTFSKDIKELHAIVKSAHETVRSTAKSLKTAQDTNIIVEDPKNNQ